MDLAISIPNPILGPGQSFKLRYRPSPAGTWVLITPNKTNVPFTVTGLSAGPYDFEFTLVKADSSECVPFVKTITVLAEMECIDATGIITVSDKGVYSLQITYTGTAGACSYEVVYGVQGQAQTTVQYGTLPASPIILPASNATYTVQIIAYTCDGKGTVCYDDVVAPPVEDCTPVVLNSTAFVTIAGVLNIRLTFTQSTPPTTSFAISYQQIGAMQFGVPDPGGTFNAPATASTTNIYIPVHPNQNPVPANGILHITYTGSLVDRCNKTHPWSVDLALS